MKAQSETIPSAVAHSELAWDVVTHFSEMAPDNVFQPSEKAWGSPPKSL